jgi:hypothetical protein
VEITSFPVENGVDVNDHVRKTPDTLTIDCFISNAPIYALGRGGGGQKSISLDVAEVSGAAGTHPGGRLRCGRWGDP